MSADISLVMDHRLFRQHNYALLNPLQVDAAQWQHLPTRALVPEMVSAQPTLMPRLVLLNRLSDDERMALLDKSDAWQAANDAPLLPVLLDYRGDPDVLAAHLKKQMLARHTSGDWFWIRFHDPRVYRHLHWVLDTTQLSRLLGPCSALTWFDPTQMRWYSDPRAPQEQTPASRFSNQQWDSIFRMELLNRVLKQLRYDHPDMPLEPADYRRIDETIRVAVDIEKLQDTDDQVAYACNTHLFGAGFHGHPLARQCLDDVRRGAYSYVGGMADAQPGILASLNETKNASSQGELR